MVPSSEQVADAHKALDELKYLERTRQVEPGVFRAGGDRERVERIAAGLTDSSTDEWTDAVVPDWRYRRYVGRLSGADVTVSHDLDES